MVEINTGQSSRSLIIDGGFVGCTVAVICNVRIVSSVGTKEGESTGDSVTAGMSVELVVIVGFGMIVSDVEKLVSFDNSETEQAVRIAKKLRSRSLVIVGYCMRSPKSWNNIRRIRVSFIFVNKYLQSMHFTQIVFVEVGNGRIPNFLINIIRYRIAQISKKRAELVAVVQQLLAERGDAGGGVAAPAQVGGRVD